MIGEAAPAAARADAPRMAILPFENRTFEPNIEQKYTSYTRREFSAGSGVRVVTDPREADLLLKGQVIWLMLPAISFTQSQTFEYRVSVRVEATVEDAKTRKVVWKQGSTGWSEYFLTTNIQFNRVLQDRAVEQAGIMVATDLAARFLAYLESGAQPTPSGSVPTGTEVLPLKPPSEKPH